MNACIGHTRTFREIGEITGCGNFSARSSVKINLRHVCRPVAAPLQEFPTSGFYSESAHAVSDVWSTRSGLCLKPKASPTVARLASRICAESSLRAARLVSKGQRISCSINPVSSQSHCLARLRSRLFFEVTHELS
jgi:hypothetical protein